jgi:pimeloyl-ACP methyl ester carboxylesterase
MSQNDKVTGLIQIPIGRNEETKANIVFIHGLGGDSLLTWHYHERKHLLWDEHNFWPGWLADALPGFKVWLFGYDSKKFFLEKGHDNHRYDIARNLLGYLRARQLEQKPLWFVSHSLGGLVVKQMLRVAKDGDLPILEQVKGVVFLATPHLGSDLAKSGNILSIISLNLLKVTLSVEELQSHNVGLRDLDEWYRSNTQECGIKTFPFYEMNKTWGFKVVDADSANPRVHQQEFCTPVESDHIGIARCRSRDDLVYTSVKQFIEKYSREDIIEEHSSEGTTFKSDTLRYIDKEKGSNSHKNNPDTIESNTIRDNELYEALKLLNFRNQYREISDRIPSQTMGSFLICGEKKSGTEILLENLSIQKTYFPIPITLGGNQGFNITTLWQKIAEILKLEKESSLETILSKIVEIQQEQSILVVLKSIEMVLPQDISDILTEFWGKLIEQIPKIGTDSRNINNLFLFLVDYQNKYKNEKFCLPFDSRLFTENFTQNDISDWILSVRNLWGHELCDEQNLDCGKAARIFQDSEGGLPHRVYETIYGYFPLAWQSSIMINKLGL